MRGEIVHDDDASVVLARRQSAQQGDEELADAHAHGAPEEEGTTAPCVAGVQARDGGGDVDGRRDHGDDKGVVDARVEKVLCSVVKDEVDA